MALYELDGVRPAITDTERCWIAESAEVIGNVALSEDVGIWSGAVLRGDDEKIAIGKGTNIQEGVMGHVDPGYPLTIGENCTIGHHAIVHGCTIGDNCLVGMGATILNGAVLGKNCLVGANALVTEGKIFPDNSLIVGSPAKAVRTLDATGVAALHASAISYQNKFRRFSKGLRKID